jgi:hypothetical protein
MPCLFHSSSYLNSPLGPSLEEFLKEYDSKDYPKGVVDAILGITSAIESPLILTNNYTLPRR